jgi:hypothetical protein
MTIADKARDAAIHCEMVKYAYRQTKDGVVVSFVLHPNDIPAALSTSHIGARYMVALVEIDDNEQPKPKPEKEKPETPPVSIPATLPVDTDKPLSGAKRPWEDFQPAQQAGMRSHDVRFEHFLEEEYPTRWRELQDTAECIRSICGVHSRAELNTGHANRVLWTQLDKHFQAWLLKEKVGA